MRKLVAPVLVAAVALSGYALAGCKASVQVGTEEPKKAPPPPKPEPKKEEPKPKPKIKLKLGAFKKKGTEIELPAPVPFETGSAKLDTAAGADDILELVKGYMDQNPDVTLLRIEGHTDSDGDDNMNLQLSKDRAMSVSRWLTAHGIQCKRLLPVGFGETRPLVPNDSPESKAKNRRVSFFDAAVKGKPVQDDKGKPVPVDNGGQSAGDPCS